MENETAEVTAQSDDSRSDLDQTVLSLQAEVQALRAQNEELNSRIGDMARKHGEEKKAVVDQWQSWADNTEAYYAEMFRQKDQRIASLEDQLVQELPQDGARLVLEDRKKFEDDQRAAIERRNREAQDAQRELANEKRKAMAAFGLTEADLAGATTADSVWAIAGEINRRKIEEIVESRIPKAPEPVAPPAPEPVETPSNEGVVPPVGNSRPAAPTASRKDSDVQTRLALLEREKLEASRNRNFNRVSHLITEIANFKREHGLS